MSGRPYQRTARKPEAAMPPGRSSRSRGATRRCNNAAYSYRSVSQRGDQGPSDAGRGDALRRSHYLSRGRHRGHAAERDRRALQPPERGDRDHRDPTHGSRHGERSEEHTSELQSLMRISYAVFCLKKKKITKKKQRNTNKSKKN